MLHRIEIDFESDLPRESLERRLEALSRGGPFAVGRLVPCGAGRWTLWCGLAKQGTAVGFGKVAELQILLARQVEPIAVRVIPAGRSTVPGPPS